VVRAAALSIRTMPYVDAARAAGYSTGRIIFRHMAPNVVAPYYHVHRLHRAGDPARSFALLLGLGVTEPTPPGLDALGQRGGLLSRGAVDDPVPGAAISLAVFAFNLFGEVSRLSRSALKT